MLKLYTGYEKYRARIEIFPMIDIMFLVLIYFIYTMLSMAILRNIKVIIPKAEGDISVKKNFFMIAIDDNNQIYVEGKAVSMEEAVEIVSNKLKKDGCVSIAGDERSDLGISLKLLAALQSKGIKDVVFKVKK